MGKKKQSDWDILRHLIVEYGGMCRSDEMKGGGDPADIEVIQAQYQLAHARLEAFIQKMQRERSER